MWVPASCLGNESAAVDDLHCVTVSGDPRARGLAHGEEFRELVHRGLGQWKDALAARLGSDPHPYLRRLREETAFAAAMDRWTPGLTAEIAGIAEGAAVDPEDVFAYQLADEEWWYFSEATARPAPDSPDGEACSGFAVRRGSAVAPLLGQNMDLPSHFDGTQIVLRVDTGEREIVLLTAAGYLGLTGCNDAGVGLCVNTLMSLKRSRQGLPVAAVVRGVLERPTGSEARRFVETVPHASGQNYLIASRDGVVDLEASAGRVMNYEPDGQCVWHTNHPLVNDDVQDSGKDGAAGATGNSAQRFEFLGRKASDVRDLPALKRLLSDTSVPLCIERDSGRGSITFGSIVMSLNDPPSVAVTLGPPTQTAWQDVAFSSRAAAAR